MTTVSMFDENKKEFIHLSFYTENPYGGHEEISNLQTLVTVDVIKTAILSLFLIQKKTPKSPPSMMEMTLE